MKGESGEHPSRRTQRRARDAAIVVLLVVVGPACGGDAVRSGSEPEAEAQPEAEAKQASEVIERCLVDAGFGPRPPERDKGEWAAAFERCANENDVRDKVLREPDPAAEARNRERLNKELLSTVDCLRARGWELPEPVADSDGYLRVPEDEAMEASVSEQARPRYASDVKECRKLAD